MDAVIYDRVKVFLWRYERSIMRIREGGLSVKTEVFKTDFRCCFNSSTVGNVTVSIACYAALPGYQALP